MFKQFLLAALLILVAPATASAAIDIGLVVDGSGSIDGADWQLQREGFSTALRDPANVPLDGSVAITVVQFSSGTQVEVPRTLIDSKEKLDGVVAKIESMEQRQSGTDPDNGITAGVEALKPFREDTKTVLCLSSDGTGGDLTDSVAAAKTAGHRALLGDRHRRLRQHRPAAQLLRPARLRRRRDDDRPQHGRVRVADRGLLLRRCRHAAGARGQPGRAGLAQLQDPARGARDRRPRVRRDAGGCAGPARHRPPDRPP